MTLNPNVTFDSIAGLSEAKRLLKEAVVLPLYMPGALTPHVSLLSQVSH